MHARELVELAAVVACHGPVLIHTPKPLADGALEAYWAASKHRLDEWGRALRTIRTAARAEQPDPAFVTSVLEEILSSEVLTRVWTAVLAGCERAGHTRHCEAIGRSIYLGQVAARLGVLQLLDETAILSPHNALSLNRLRRRVDGWSDLLVGHLAIDSDVSEFAAEPARAKQFADEIRQRPYASQTQQAWRLVQVALHAAFRPAADAPTPHTADNSRVASAILACFPNDLCNASGPFATPWLTRFAHAAVDEHAAEPVYARDVRQNGYVDWPTAR